MFSISYSHPKPQFCSILFQKQNLGSPTFVSIRNTKEQEPRSSSDRRVTREWVLYAGGRLCSVLHNKQKAVW